MTGGCDEHLRECLPARTHHIAELRHAIVQFAAGCGASGRQLEDIALAVSEALSNAVLHAYVGQDAPGHVSVDAWLQEDALVVDVCDEGIGVVPRTDSPGLGLGLPLIAQLTQHLEVESPDDASGVHARMTFAIG